MAGVATGTYNGNKSSSIGNANMPGGSAQVVTGLRPKERAAISALQKEKAPVEYQNAAQQCMKNLAEGDSAVDAH